MRADLIEAMNWQAESMLPGMESQLKEIFPEGTTDATLKVTGFVLRPATEDDLEDDEGGGPDLFPSIAEDMYVFEAHFLAENNELLGNLSSSLMLHFEGCNTYEEAVAIFIQGVDKQKRSIN